MPMMTCESRRWYWMFNSMKYNNVNIIVSFKILSEIWNYSKLTFTVSGIGLYTSQIDSN